MTIPLSRSKSLLCPKFAEQLTQFEASLVAAGLPFELFVGLRSFDQQEELYAQGRSKPGPPCSHKGELNPRPLSSCPIHPKGLTVTNARGGDSWHNYGLAADYVLDGQTEKPGLQWSWDIKADLNHDGRNDWLQLAELAVACGLEAGFFFKIFPDAPHVQNRFGLTIMEAKELCRVGGIKKIWQTISI